MKKPKITYNPLKVGDSETITEGGSVIINGKELFEDDCAELISEMIDALIEAKINISDMVDDFNNGELMRRIEHDRDTTIESIDKALKKAGVE